MTESMMQLKIPPPEPRGRHLPPETIHPLKGKPETGMYAAGMIHSRWQVTATVVSLSGVSRSAFSRRKPGASSRWPSGRILSTRCLCPSPDTWKC